MKINLAQIPSPCFVLEEELLHKNLQLINRVQQESGATIILATKGFAMYSAFPLVKKYLKGTTASSLHEARLGFEEFGGEVHAYSPAYLEKEFDEMIRYCDHLSFNSLNQWKKYKTKIEQSGKKISCGLRINPEYAEVSIDLYNPCIAGSRLGMRASDFGENLPEGIEGLHFHTLCESDSFALERTLKAVEEKFGPLIHQAKWLNMGGGHLMTRKGYDTEHLINLLRYIADEYNVQVYLEPGSAVAWETGYLVATVEDIINSAGVQVAILDISFTAHTPDCLEMPYKPKIIGATDPDENSKNVYRMGGLSCLAGDYLGDYAFEYPLSVGDTLVFNDMIHYTMVKTTTFNGVNLPSIGIWKENQTFELVKSFGYAEYKSRI
jgi:carboxynorspermidine decarboxylase